MAKKPWRILREEEKAECDVCNEETEVYVYADSVYDTPEGTMAYCIKCDPNR